MSLAERHTADTITDDELDALYDALAQAEATRRVWQGTANRCATQATEQQARADKAARATDLLAEQYRALEEQLARFHEGEEPYVDEHTEATPAQWIWLWNRATPERRLEVAKDIRAHAALADRCFMGNHETRLDQQQARLTRLEAEREQAEDLLRVAHETSNRSEAERASAVRRAELADAVTAETKRLMERRTTTLRIRAEQAEERRDQLAATLDDVLRHFVRKGHPGAPCLESGWVREDTVAKWRAVLYPPATEEQPDA